jgi:hypothetical protein
MRLWKIIAALPTMAIAFVFLKFTLWKALPENNGGDGTCDGLELDLYRLMSIVFILISGAILLRKNAFGDFLGLLCDDRDDQLEEDTNRWSYTLRGQE